MPPRRPGLVTAAHAMKGDHGHALATRLVEDAPAIFQPHLSGVSEPLWAEEHSPPGSRSALAR